jgi:hypothetical protein
MVAILGSKLAIRTSGASEKSRLNWVDLRRDCTKDFVDEFLLTVSDCCCVDSLESSLVASYGITPSSLR